jgi:metallophosphoesterase (TIGR00282 family)
MIILMFGDVVGRSGRDALCARLPELRERLKADFVVVNGENAAGGYGITGKICSDLYAAGADVVTTGNHVWDQRETVGYIDGDPRLLRPENFPKGTPGRGVARFETAQGRSVLVVHVMLRLFMDPLDDPFACVDAVMSRHTLGGSVDAILVDIHGEATSEKQAFAYHVDGRASAVVGTHTHVPTADWRVLPEGTGYISDLGMCGDYESVIGMRHEGSVWRFTRKLPSERLKPAEGEATLCAVLIETDDETGRTRRIEPLRLGGCLAEHWPSGAGDGP